MRIATLASVAALTLSGAAIAGVTNSQPTMPGNTMTTPNASMPGDTVPAPAENSMMNGATDMPSGPTTPTDPSATNSMSPPR
jgi:hypothetical protein